MTPTPAAEPGPAELPPVVQAMLDHPIVERRSWLTTIAPAYLGVFIWVPFLDAHGRAGAGSPGAGLGALAAVFLGYGLLYIIPAQLGWASGARLPVAGSTALGATGAEWILGVLHGLYGLAWAAVAVFFSVKLVLLGLAVLGLLDPAELAPWSVGGLTLESPLFLVAGAYWTFIIAAANGLRLVSVIAALMKVYAPVAGLLLVGIAAWAWSHADPSATIDRAPWRGFDANAFQLVFGYFAFAGLMGVEWGAAVRDSRDVDVGGRLGILAGGSAATFAAIVLGASDPGATGSDALDVLMPTGSFQGAIHRVLGTTLGSKTAGAVLLLFGLAALAPACHGSALFTTRCRGHWPALRRWNGVALFFAGILALVGTGIAGRTDVLFAISGALFAPAGGILTVETMWNLGRRLEVPLGWRLAGGSAWAVGAAVGLAPVLGAAAGISWLGAVQPASLYAYIAAAAVYAPSVRPAADGTARTEPPGEDG